MKNLTLNCEFEIYQYDELAEDERELIDRAKSASERSYSPYSGFSVGAAVLLDNGTIIEGNNQENAAYPSGICAERTTLFYANSAYPDNSVTKLAIAAQTKGKFVEDPIPPCGSCRQVILETEKRYGHPIRILLYGQKHIYATEGVKNLLPLSFDASNMNL